MKDKGLTANRLSKLDVVVKYIEKHEEIGDVLKPKSYFKGTMKMHTVISEEYGMVLFCWAGKKEDKDECSNRLVLSGSAAHVIGMENCERIYSNSITINITRKLGVMRDKQLELETLIIEDDINYETEKTSKNYLEDISLRAGYSKGPEQTYEFLARRYKIGNGAN